jgi:hypothetical protein
MNWKKGSVYSDEKMKIFSDYSIINNGNTKKLVCKVSKKHPDFEKNIKLIEAAPELLDICNQIVKKCKNRYAGKREKIEFIYDICSEIIKRLM